MKEAFLVFDKSGDGMISAESLVTLMRLFEIELTETELEFAT